MPRSIHFISNIVITFSILNFVSVSKLIDSVYCYLMSKQLSFIGTIYWVIILNELLLHQKAFEMYLILNKSDQNNPLTIYILFCWQTNRIKHTTHFFQNTVKTLNYQACFIIQIYIFIFNRKENLQQYINASHSFCSVIAYTYGSIQELCLYIGIIHPIPAHGVAVFNTFRKCKKGI